MEALLLLAVLVIIVLAAAMVRAWTVAEQTARREAEAARRSADQARTDLSTTRRIQDATEAPLPVDAARGWLRDFAAGGDPGER